MRAEPSRQTIRNAVTLGSVATARRFLPRVSLDLLLLVLLPTALAAIYLYGVAADRFICTFQYTIRGGGDAPVSRPARVEAGYALVAYLRSPAAFDDVQQQLPIRRFLSDDGGDFLRGYDRGLPAEAQVKHWRRMIDARFDPVTGITRVSVGAFDPRAAFRVARTLTSLLQTKADHLSGAGSEAMLDLLAQTVEQAELELRGAIHALERSAEGVTVAAAATTGPVARPPRLQRLRRTYQVALDSYLLKQRLYLQASARARHQGLELAIIAPPVPPETATEPRRWLWVLVVAAASTAIWASVRILLRSARLAL